MTEFDDLIDELEESRETRMPKVDGVPITEGLSEGDQGGIENAGVEEVPQDRGTSTSVVLSASPSENSAKIGPRPPSAGPGKSGRRAGHSRESKRTRSEANALTAPQAGSAARSCTAYAPAGTTCKLCGKVHPRGEIVLPSVSSGYAAETMQKLVRSDFKKPRGVA
jgi:ribosomal protein L32